MLLSSCLLICKVSNEAPISQPSKIPLVTFLALIRGVSMENLSSASFKTEGRGEAILLVEGSAFFNTQKNAHLFDLILFAPVYFKT